METIEAIEAIEATRGIRSIKMETDKIVVIMKRTQQVDN